jgi:hypothetical protein
MSGVFLDGSRQRPRRRHVIAGLVPDSAASHNHPVAHAADAAGIPGRAEVGPGMAPMTR